MPFPKLQVLLASATEQGVEVLPGRTTLKSRFSHDMAQLHLCGLCFTFSVDLSAILPNFQCCFHCFQQYAFAVRVIIISCWILSMGEGVQKVKDVKESLYYGAYYSVSK